MTEFEIEKLIAACADPANRAARNLLACGGTHTATGIVARLALVTPDMRALLGALIHHAIAEHEMAATGRG